MENNKKIRIAFDVDDTLIIPPLATGLSMNVPNYENIRIYKHFQSLGCYMILWSWTGMEWAQKWAEILDLKPDEIRIKQKSDDVDISFDDVTIDFATTNIRVEGINKEIPRYEWEKKK
jgi:hypothetical protein